MPKMRIIGLQYSLANGDGGPGEWFEHWKFPTWVFLQQNIHACVLKLPWLQLLLRITYAEVRIGRRDTLKSGWTGCQQGTGSGSTIDIFMRFYSKGELGWINCRHHPVVGWLVENSKMICSQAWLHCLLDQEHMKSHSFYAIYSTRRGRKKNLCVDEKAETQFGQHCPCMQAIRLVGTYSPDC